METAVTAITGFWLCALYCLHHQDLLISTSHWTVPNCPGSSSKPIPAGFVLNHVWKTLSILFTSRSGLVFLKQIIALLGNNIINDLLNKDGATIDKSTSWGNFFGSQVPSLPFFLMIKDFLKRAIHAPGRGIRFLFKEKRNLEQHRKTKTKQNKTWHFQIS